MSTGINLTLKRKLLLLVMAVSAVMLVVVGSSLLTYQLLDQRTEAIHDNTILAKSFASNAAAAVAFGDVNAAQEQLNHLRFDEDVQYGALRTRDGALLAEFKRSASWVPGRAEIRESTSFDAFGLRLSLPVNLDGETIGWLYIESTAARYFHRIKIFSLVVLFSITVSLAIGSWLASRMQTIISQPIIKLADTAREVSVTGDYTLRVGLRTEDEIGRLGNDFDEMLGKIEASRDALYEAQHGLEERVRERTEELIDEMTRRQQAVRAMEREREQLRSVILNAPVAMAMFDPTLRYLVANHEWHTVHRIPADLDLTGVSHFDILPLAEESCGAIVGAAARGERLAKDEDRIIVRDGSTVLIRWAAQPYYDPDGEIAGIIKVIERIDDLVNSRENAIKLATLRSQFLANVSHELRTPLNGLIGFTTLLQETPLSEEQAEYVETIKSSASALLDIINGILDFAKIESGKLELAAVPFELDTLVSTSMGMVRAMAMQKGLVLSLSCENSLPPRLLGDSVRIQQVLTNLLGNAVKFTGSGEVAVSVSAASHDGNTVLLQFDVKDTGIGIPADKLHNIFEPFSQVDGSTTRVYGGTGLGLAICAQLVEVLGGRIWVESTVGTGSVFHFTARVQLTDEVAAAASLAAAPEIPSSRRMSILVAEDNKVNQRLVARMLEQEGHRVVIAENGKLAIEQLALEAFDLVLMDLQMPILGGIEATRHIRTNGPSASRSIPIVALSAHVFQDDQRLCEEAGMDGFIAKPIQRDELRRVLARFGAPARLDLAGEAPLELGAA